MLLGDSGLHFGRMLFPPAPSNHCHTINDFVGTASPSIHTHRFPFAFVLTKLLTQIQPISKM